MRGLIFDLDGTLVDTNPTHVEAWRRALQRFGFEVPRERIEIEIGKGGDKLVPSVLGAENEKRLGEALRKTQKEEFLTLAEEAHFRVFPGAIEILEELAGRGVRRALATSSDDKHLKATFESAGVDFATLVDVVVTKSDADASKPDPDIVEAAARKLDLTPPECAMVGDTIYDGEACAAAGVPFLGVLSGGTPAEELLAAGAVAVWRDTAHLLDELDHALDLAAQTIATR